MPIQSALIGPDPVALQDAITRRMLAATKQALAETGEAAKQGLRQQIRSAGLGNRLPNAVGVKIFPAGDKLARKPVVQIAPRGKGAARILHAFSTGPQIRGKDNQSLAIPLEAAPRGPRGVPIGPAEAERRCNRDFVSIPLRRGKATVLLCMPAVAGARRNGSRFRPAKGGRLAQGRGAELVPMYILIPTVRLPKLLSPDEVVRDAVAGFPDRLRRALAAIRIATP
jgi:hypothetical protein